MAANLNDNLELLRTFAHRNDPERVIESEQALLPLGEDAIDVLKTALGDPDADLRILGLQLLEHWDRNTEAALLVMIEALNDSDRTVRITALAPVARLGEKATDAISTLEKWIGCDDEFSHVSAAGHILMIDPTRSKYLVPVLLKALESDDFGIRCQTAWLLGQLGEIARNSVPELERLLEDENSTVRRVAREALASRH